MNSYVLLHVCAIVAKTGFLKKGRILVFFPLVTVGEYTLWSFSQNTPVIEKTILPTILFYIGIIAYIYRDVIILDVRVFITTVFAMIFSLTIDHWFLGMVFCFPIYVFMFGFLNDK